MMPGMYPTPYQGGTPSYPQTGYSGFHAAGGFDSNMAPQPAGAGIFAAGYSTQPPQGPPIAPTNLQTPATTPHRFRERIYYYDNETKQIHLDGPDSPPEHGTRPDQFSPLPANNIPGTNSGRGYYIDENSGHKITIAPNAASNISRPQRRSRHLELTREGSGEFEVKLWRGGDHRCEKAVRVASGPGDDDVDIKLSECQICDNHDHDKDRLDELERQRLHQGVVANADEQKFKRKIRQEEYARMKADQKLKLEIREELRREEELMRVQRLQDEKRAEKMEAERRATEELERERIRNEVKIELEKHSQAHNAKLEAEKQRMLQMQELIREDARRQEIMKEMEERRQAQLAKVEEENKKKLEEEAKQEARKRERVLQLERDRIRQEVDAELARREQTRLAEIEAKKRQIEEEERLKKQAKAEEFAMQMERERLANLAEIVAEEKRKAEELQKAEVEARRLESDRMKAEEDKIRREEWEKVRGEEMRRIREEIRAELNEAETKRVLEERTKSEILRLQQLEADRIRSDEQVRLRVEAGREELKREIRLELEKYEQARISRLTAETAALKARIEAEKLAKEHARIRDLAEAQRIRDQITHEEAIKKRQREQAEAEMRRLAQTQVIALEKEKAKIEAARVKKQREDEAAMAANMARVVAEENEMRRIIRAEIKEDMRKARAWEDGKLVEQLNRFGGNNDNSGAPQTLVSPSQRERVQLHWETDFVEGHD